MLDWDVCRRAIFRAADLFRPGIKVLDSAELDRYIYDDGRKGSYLQWKETWKSQTGQDLDDLTLESMRKVFLYVKLMLRARQKIILNVELAHALFILQLLNTVAQSLQHAYRSNRLFWHQVNAYSFSDAILLAAYPTKLFTTVVMFARLLICTCAVNSFFREVSLRAKAAGNFCAQGIIMFYLATTPPDLVAVILLAMFNISLQAIYMRKCKPWRQWKGICYAIVSASTLFLVPLLVHSLSRWTFAASSMATTIALRLCDMERVVLWDVQGYDMSDLTLHVLASLDQNVVGLLVDSSPENL